MAADKSRYPVKQILGAVTALAGAAATLWRNPDPEPPAPPVEEPPDASGQLKRLSDRLSASEGLQKEQARIVMELAAQVEALARRAAIGYRLGIAGVVIACVAIVVVLVR